MPIFSTRPTDLLPFINRLEENINEMLPAVQYWERESGKVMEGINSLSMLDFKASSAMGQAGMALAELGNATAAISVQMPNRLKTLIENLRSEMESGTGGAGTGGGGAGFDARINAEIDNAISSVDEVVGDGLKLDYRLRKLQELAERGGSGGAANKDLIFPYSTSVGHAIVEDHIQLPKEEGVIFIPGVVTVLNNDLGLIFADEERVVEAIIDSEGLITFNTPPNEAVKLYYPVQMDLQDAPKDFLMVFLDLVISKNSSLYQSLSTFDGQLKDINEVLKQMQGANWTEEFSIMRNHQELIKESIAPKGLDVEVQGDKVHMTFSYSDHPHLSHFIGEKWDEETMSWVPYDGQFGVISK